MSSSSTDSESRTEPPPARVTKESTPGATATSSATRKSLLDVGAELERRHEPEGVVVGAGADRADDLLGLGRREDELHVLGRLLDDSQFQLAASPCAPRR